MQINIKFCGMWGYKSQAQSVANEIKDKYPSAIVELVKGDRGIFEVMQVFEGGGVILFDKNEEQRFPIQEEIVELIHDDGYGGRKNES